MYLLFQLIYFLVLGFQLGLLLLNLMTILFRVKQIEKTEFVPAIEVFQCLLQGQGAPCSP